MVSLVRIESLAEIAARSEDEGNAESGGDGEDVVDILRDVLLATMAHDGLSQVPDARRVEGSFDEVVVEVSVAEKVIEEKDETAAVGEGRGQARFIKEAGLVVAQHIVVPSEHRCGLEPQALYDVGAEDRRHQPPGHVVRVVVVVDANAIKDVVKPLGGGQELDMRRVFDAARPSEAAESGVDVGDGGGAGPRGLVDDEARRERCADALGQFRQGNAVAERGPKIPAPSREPRERL